VNYLSGGEKTGLSMAYRLAELVRKEGLLRTARCAYTGRTH
jgi:hypothetical protein